MKTFLKSKLIDKKCVKSIIKERNLMSKINHPFIVNMHFSFQDNHYLYMILDLMKGGDLRYYIKLSEKSKKISFACAYSTFFAYFCAIYQGYQV